VETLYSLLNKQNIRRIINKAKGKCPVFKNRIKKKRKEKKIS
jgi:hypothetical protein